jgi:hypothetical protein
MTIEDKTLTRTAYIHFYPEDEQKPLQKFVLVLQNERPNVPYYKVRIEVIEIEPNYAIDRKSNANPS